MVRTFSILAVMAAHTNGIALPSPALRQLWLRINGNGTYGVCAFFVVSGFLITRLLDSGKQGLFRPQFKEFYVRRAARIFPLLFLAIGLGVYVTFFCPGKTFLFFYCFRTMEMKFDFLFWLSICTFLNNWYQVIFYNYPALHWVLLWSLSVEEQFYLFYPPLLKRLGNEKRFVLFMAGVIAFGFLWRWGVYEAGVEGATYSLKSSFGAFDQIAFGALLYLTVRSYGEYLLNHKSISALICVFGALIVMGTYLNTSISNRGDLIYGPTFIALGSSLFLLGGLHLSIFESKYLTFLTWPGKYSYGNYLLHVLVYYYLFSFLVDKNIYVALMIFVIVSTTVAAISHQFFELPANRFVRELLTSKIE